MDAREVLLKYWGYSQFRSLQDEIIQSVHEGHDTLALMPTGGGKSICYQIPALMKPGLCLVVSPLISLIKDQVEQLRRRKINASALFSGLSPREMDLALQEAIDGKLKFLFVSPERLGTAQFQQRISYASVNLLAVDEAHCISQWGYDFRPAYLRIAEIRSMINPCPVIALTATATIPVRDDIVDKLRFRAGKIFIKSFERPNISYAVLHEENKLARVASMLKKKSGSALVFAGTRKRTKEISDYLVQEKIAASFYHAGLTADERNRRQREWIDNKIRVMVCTNAFGMGIDKPDVRLVIHYEPPINPESYFQEAGRSGRDEKKAFAVCLYDHQDIISMQERVDAQFPSEQEIKIVYHALSGYTQIAIGGGMGVSFDFDLQPFCKKYELDPVSTLSALKTLELEGYIALSDAILVPSRLMIKVNKEQLYRFQLQNPKAEPIINALLRMYGGIFDYYTTISERDLAGYMNTSPLVVEKALRALHQRDYIDYVPATDKPQLTYIAPRHDTSELHIDTLLLRKRKESFRLRMQAMINYLETRWKCRSQALLQYFGEDQALRCGVCDVCLRRHELDVSDIEFEKLVGAMKRMLQNKTLSIKQLHSELKNYPEQHVTNAVRWLIDSNLVAEDEKGHLRWQS